jgi:PhzF family phenazine biosynthesis protein
MRLPIYQVDAFTDRLFAGNPAAVVPLDGEWLPPSVMQSIAAENNLAETAFIRRTGAGWAIRWFTPTVEMDLCGHATLASAFVINTILTPNAGTLEFSTQVAGPLRVSCEGDLYTLDFPARPAMPAQAPSVLNDALGGGEPLAVLAGRDFLVVYGDAAVVRSLKPDFAALERLGRMVIVTAPGEDVDFVSRFFAPSEGIPEDPVTGAAHCVLIPYWADRLGKNVLEARQVSQRGGRLHCQLAGDRVRIGGRAVLYLEGAIHV